MRPDAPSAAVQSRLQCNMSALFALLALAAAPLPALATGPTETARAFSALVDGTWRLYWQPREGSEPLSVPLANVRGDQLAARLSPDGRQVAFEVAGQGLFVCPLPPGTDTADPAARGGCQRLSAGDGDPVRPDWNPLTGELMFVRFRVGAGNEQSDIALASADLSKVQPVLDQTGIQDFPDVSPDGSRLAYTSWQTVMPFRAGVQVIQQLWVLDLSRGVAGQVLLSNASDIHPRWSPDGKRLAFSSNRTGRYEIWVVAADGSGLLQLTDGPGDKTWPVWSPDGTSILFNRIQLGRFGLAVVAVATREIASYAPPIEGTQHQIRDPDWISPRRR